MVKRKATIIGMNLETKRMKRLFIKATKIGVGSFIAILIAHSLGLANETSAGIITLLSIMTTRWETLRISLYRVISFAITVLLCFVVFSYIGANWLCYGIVILVLVLVLEMLGWASTLSVNAVIAAHFASTSDFTLGFILNEFLLVLIGITVAVVLNFFSNHKRTRKELVAHMHYVEDTLQMILSEMADYLSKKEMQRNVWDDIIHLEEKIKEFILEACQYRDNTFSSHPEYYINYFEMRMQQMNVLHNLHYEVKKMRDMPAQAQVVADYIRYMMRSIKDKNTLEEQIGKLQSILSSQQVEHLPKDMEEFHGLAILYHILMDLEDFLIIKKRFVDELDDSHKERETFIID